MLALRPPSARQILEVANIFRGEAASFLQDYKAWIAFPKEVTFFASSDGERYKEALHVTNTIPADNDHHQTIRLGGDSSVRKARFIKVYIKNHGTLPSPYPGAGGDAYIFIDEISID